MITNQNESEDPQSLEDQLPNEEVEVEEEDNEEADEADVYMPLAQGLYDILFNQVSVTDAVSQLMLGEQSEDVEFLLSSEEY